MRVQKLLCRVCYKALGAHSLDELRDCDRLERQRQRNLHESIQRLAERQRLEAGLAR